MLFMFLYIISGADPGGAEGGGGWAAPRRPHTLYKPYETFVFGGEYQFSPRSAPPPL